MKRNLVSFFFLILLCAAILPAQDKEGKPSAAATAQPSTAAPANPLSRLGFSPSFYAAPSLTVRDLNGNSVSLTSLRGKIVFLNFWATWCPPCRMEMPSIQRLFETMDRNQFAVMAVDLGEPAAEVKNFIQKNRYTFPIYIDIDDRGASAYRVEAVPSTFVIDRMGNVIGAFVGSRSWDTPDVIEAFRKILTLP
jgi:thiol-disulfide isomerase/thioredoxin